MKGLNTLEQSVIDKLLSGDHPVLAALRVQAERARLVGREHTGVGFFCDFDVPSDAPILKGDFHLGDVKGDLQGLANGAGFVLFIRDGHWMRWKASRTTSRGRRRSVRSVWHTWRSHVNCPDSRRSLPYRHSWRTDHRHRRDGMACAPLSLR